MLKAYVISLDCPKDLFEQIKSQGINPVLVEGVNGKLLSDEEIKNNTTFFYQMFGPRSAIGCAMAHIKAWKEFLKSNDDLAIVFEDDVVFEPEFKETLPKIIESMPSDTDYLLLGCHGCDSSYNLFTKVVRPFPVTNMIKEEDINEYLKVPSFATAAHAYVITRRGAEKLTSLLDKKIWYHIDLMLYNLHFHKKINLYCLKKRLVHQTSTDTCNSSQTTAKYPYLLHKATSQIEVDKMVKMNYMLTVPGIVIGNFGVSNFTVLWLVIGVVLAVFKVSIVTTTIFFILFSVPDFLYPENYKSILAYYCILVFPSIISRFVRPE